MWFWYALIAMLCWSGSDLFSKIGCADPRDDHSHLKMVMAVGFVMGLHAAWEVFARGVEISFTVILTYLPVSLLYILSMAIGYLGLRYIELSISSPVCNSSGALVAILILCTSGRGSLVTAQIAAMALICFGVVMLGIVEAREDEELRLARQKKGNYQYAKSWLALTLPVVYCLLDALGTFADSIILERLNEDSANVAYELTFLMTGIAAAVYVLVIKKDMLIPKWELPKYTGAIFETGGQLAYIYAISDQAHVALSAPIISAYCTVSVLWGRLFLGERLSRRHYLCILLVVIGVVILGFFDA